MSVLEGIWLMVMLYCPAPNSRGAEDATSDVEGFAASFKSPLTFQALALNTKLVQPGGYHAIGRSHGTDQTG